MVDLSIESVIGIIAQNLCGGSTVIAGLLVMMACFFVAAMVMANIGAPITYSLVPMVILDIIFGAIGVLDPTVSFVIVILCAVVMAKQARELVGGS